MAGVKRSRILIVDDDPINLLVLEEILSKRFDIATAGTGEDAAATASVFKPDLILIDLLVEDASGYEICRKLRATPKLKLTKIILVSTKALLKDRLFGYQAGADDYIARPFDPDELLAKVGVFIRLKSVEEIDRVKDDLINVFSHETRTPLNAIIGFGRLLAESPVLAEEDKEFVKTILDSGMSLLSLSNKAVLLSTLRQENKTISRFKASLAKIVANAMQDLPDSIRARGVQVSVECQDAEVYVDEQLVETALAYVIENACKFSQPGAKAWVRSTIDKEAKTLKVSVVDEGCGIPPERLPEIFDEFGIEDVEHHNRGHGLSLSIVKLVMELHDGSVSAVNNAGGAGSTFTLAFTEHSLVPPPEETKPS